MFYNHDYIEDIYYTNVFMSLQFLFKLGHTDFLKYTHTYLCIASSGNV